MSEGRSSPAPATLPDNDDLLGEILLRLPPLPSSLPRASLVCKRWRRLLCDPGFIRRFRAHHRTPPLLGVFIERSDGPVFVPTLSTPDRIPPARFSPAMPPCWRWKFLGCRDGLASFLDLDRLEAFVWEPVTFGSERRIGFPPKVNMNARRNVYNGAVLSAAANNGDGQVHGVRSLSPFKLVLLFNKYDKNLACACLYESESGKWGNISSIAVPPRSFLIDPAVLIGNALFWHLRVPSLSLIWIGRV